MRFFARSLALQFMPIKRHAQYNADRMRPREKLSRRQSFVGAVSENGNDGYRKMFKQHSNARLEFLKFPAGRAFTFGKPNQVPFLFQNDRAKGQARTRGAHWFDRQNFSQSTQETHQWVGEDDAGPTGPISISQLTPIE